LVDRAEAMSKTKPRNNEPAPLVLGEVLSTRDQVEKPKGPRNYRHVQNMKELSELVQELLFASEFAFDTETTGLDVINDRPIGLCFSTKPESGWYVPLQEPHRPNTLPLADILSALQPFLISPKQTKIGHNLKFDWQMCTNAGIALEGPMFDTMLASYLVDPNSREHGLDSCCMRLLNFEKIKTTTVLAGHRTMLDCPLASVAEYGCEDADYTLRLKHRLTPALDRSNQTGVMQSIEIPLLKVLGTMEQHGIFVDPDTLGEISTELAHLGEKAEARIYELAGETFNINSTKQLQTILFEKLKVHEAVGATRLKKTKSGYSTDVSVLEQLSEHPLPGSILEFRTITKLKNTYVDTLPQLINPTTHRIHTTFHQTGAATGRLSSVNPNLQNIPIRSELGRSIRRAFRAEKAGGHIVSADYSQIELRLLAHIAKDQSLVEAFARGDDIHRTTAAKIFGLAPDKVDPLSRSRAKAINFGIIYGMGPTRLARETGVTMAEAKDFIAKYFASFSNIEKYIDDSIDKARRLGYTETITGRRRPIEGLQSKDRLAVVNAENIAVNSPLQGSAADLIKIAMIKLAPMLSDYRAKLLLQVHDELVFETDPGADLQKLSKMVQETMESAMQLDVPLVVNIGIGTNWLEAH
jgi:DNA polymerase-1